MSNQNSDKPVVRLGFGGGGRLTGESAKQTRPTIKRLLEYLQPYTPQLVIVSLLVLISTLLKLAGPILLGQAIDQYVIPAQAAGLARICLVMVAVYVGAGITSYIHNWLMVGIGQNLVADIRAQLFGHIQTLSMPYHDQHRSGDLMSRVTNDTEAINQVLSNGLIEFTSNILLLGGIMISMFWLNWQLAAGALVVIPIMLWITTVVTRYSRKAFREVQQNLGGLNAVMEENIAGVRAIQAFAREADSFAQFEAANAASRRAGTKADIITAALGPMFTTMSTVTIAVTALLGGWLSLRDIASVGVIATFVIYIVNFFRPMRGIAMLYNQLQSALAVAERIFTVLDEVPTIQDQPAAPSPILQGEVIFDNVTFGYAKEEPVLEEITLTAQPGQTIALVGPTGAGKTTIISLLSRFYDVDTGAIALDGHDIRALSQEAVRRQLGIVLQDTFLFSGTVMENIRYGRLTATDAEVMAAAQLSNADRFIRLLPEGYRTRVSEKGHNFSQGQRQLLAIARAILADPRILILDEATSSVDTRTELHIQEALLHLMEGRTAFVIAHRLSTIRNADLVLVVNDRRIIERGTHDELLAAGGFYHDLYMSQYRRVAAMAAAA